MFVVGKFSCSRGRVWIAEKISSLAAALGVTKFITVIVMNVATLCSAPQVQLWCSTNLALEDRHLIPILGSFSAQSLTANNYRNVEQQR
jgi:hypothetical protein